MDIEEFVRRYNEIAPAEGWALIQPEHVRESRCVIKTFVWDPLSQDEGAEEDVVHEIRDGLVYYLSPYDVSAQDPGQLLLDPNTYALRYGLEIFGERMVRIGDFDAFAREKREEHGRVPSEFEEDD